MRSRFLLTPPAPFSTAGGCHRRSMYELEEMNPSVSDATVYEHIRG
jgi:hypothetical protein